MQNMKHIMKEWRTFMKEVDTSSILLSESSSVTLSQLVLEYKNKNISKQDYVQVLCESIEEDLRWLNSQDKQVLSEAFEGLKSAFSKIKGAVIEKVKGMIAKAMELAKTAGKKAIDYCKQIDAFIQNFKKTNPAVYSLIRDLLKVASILAVAYLIYKYGISSAHAEVAVRQVGGDTVNLTGQAQAVIDVLSDPKFQDMTNIDGEIATKLIGHIKSGKKLDVTAMEDINSVLSNAISVAKSRATLAGNPFADVFNSAASAVQGVTGQVTQAVQAAGGQIKSAAQLAKSLTADDVQQAIAYLKERGLDSTDPGAIARTLIKVTKKVSSTDAGIDLVAGAVKRVMGAG